MQKISVTAPKKNLRTVIELLHSQGVMDIDEYDGELDTGSPFEESDQLSNQLVKTRSLLSKLPETEKERTKEIQETLESLEGIQEELNQLEEEKTKKESEIKKTQQKAQYFKQLKGIELDNEDLQGTENLEVFIGKINAPKLRNKLKNVEVYQGKNLTALAYHKDNKEAEKTTNELKNSETNLKYKEETGSIKQIIKQTQETKKSQKTELEEINNKIETLADEWRPSLEETEEFLRKKVEKTEAPIYFATTQHTFVAEGWVPKEQLNELKNALTDKIDSIHIEELEGDNPPVDYDNNKIVEPFESLTDLMARPRYGELDPSFMILLTFPLMFGFMIGDVGYGITSAIVFLAGMKMFPQASEIFKSLLWCSGFTVLFGIIYGEFFGFQFYESPMYRGDIIQELMYVGIAIGVAHVNIGLLLGAYNEYIKHGLKAAILEKGSWILLQMAVVAGFLINGTLGGVIALLSVAMLYKGEGIEGLVEIPSLLSNILSYMRLFGVTVAAYMLANTVNQIAQPAFATNTLFGLVLGTLILLGGHTMNTFIKIMEGFLQGIRLHYVEHFNWYYEGGGRKYNPFGKTS